MLILFYIEVHANICIEILFDIANVSQNNMKNSLIVQQELYKHVKMYKLQSNKNIPVQ